MLKNISTDNKNKEDKIFHDICNCIDNHKSIQFIAGAGSGKTYALVESIRYIIKNKNEELKRLGQKIVCITYTNVAANEVKSRLGESDLIVVSTIHDRIWDFIKGYSNELNVLHKNKLSNEINNIKNQLKSDTFKRIFEIDAKHLEKVKKNLKENKGIYYKIQNHNAREFREKINEIIPGIDNKLLGNVGCFKNWIKYEWKLESYENCLTSINNGKNTKDATYNPMSNIDHLDRMEFSHDTLLEYGLQMIEKYPILSQLISDTYPYFFIDEFQDTSTEVIRIIKNLMDNAQSCKHKFWVGFFGDPVQSIYDKGIGKKLEEILEIKLYTVFKQFNRRSVSEIIEIGNKIRNDKYNQVSIYTDDKINISPKFYYLVNSNDVDIQTEHFIKDIIKQFDISENNRLHCFVLTNRYLAHALKINGIWNFFDHSAYYNNPNNSISSELLSNDLNKLGDLQRKLYNLVNFIYLINDSNTFLNKVFIDEVIQNLNINQIITLIKRIQDICSCKNLLDTIIKMSKYCEHSPNEKDEIDCRIEIQFKSLWNKGETINLDTIITEFAEKFYSNIEYSDAHDLVIQMLSNPLDEFYRWYNHIIRNEKSDVIYHTYHSTKGLEYDNVLIIMDANWGRQTNYIHNYFLNYNSENDKMTISARNLLYVATTRAKKRLAILYRSPIEEIQNNIKSIFGSCCPVNFS